jgi:PAS domain S-box-containing protein
MSDGIEKHVISDIEILMLSKIPEKIQPLLQKIMTETELAELRVFNSKGEEVFMKEKGPPAPRVNEVLMTGTHLHFNQEINKMPVFTMIHPVENKPECQGCHGTEQKINGAVLISLPKEEFMQDISSQRKRHILLFFLIAVAVGAFTITTVYRLFFKPLKHFQEGADLIEKGQLNHTIPAESDDEIGVLAGKFNSMAQSLSEQFNMIANAKKAWQDTFDSLNDMVYILDRDSNVIRANKAYAEHHGLHPRELINKKCTKPFHRTNFFEHLSQDNITSDEDQTIIEEMLDQETNKIYRVSTFPYFSPAGDIIGSIHRAEDITREREKEMQLILSERLATLGHLAAGIAHEINNPLASIAGCAEGLLSRIEKGKIAPELFESYLKIIEEEIGRCKHITTNMLSFVKKSSYEYKHVSITETVDKAIDLIDFQGRLKDVEVIKNYSEHLPVIKGSEGDLIQVFLAIISNSLDAMQNNFNITATLKIIIDTEDEKMVIQINDTGPGIPPEHINRIFDPFFTLKSDTGGTGLGLSIAHRIITNHKGTIHVVSEPGKGTTFKITLPQEA